MSDCGDACKPTFMAWTGLSDGEIVGMRESALGAIMRGKGKARVRSPEGRREVHDKVEEG